MAWVKNVGEIINILADIITVLGIIFLFLEAKSYNNSYELSQKDYKIRNEKDEAQKAIELAKFYAREIINNIGYIEYIYREAGIQKYIEEIDDNLIREFDLYEMKKIVPKKAIEEVQKKLGKFDLEVLIDASSLLEDKGLDEYLNGLTTLKIHKRIIKSKEDKVAKSNPDKKIAEEEIASGLEKNNAIEKKRKLEENLRSYEYYAQKYENEFLTVLVTTLNNLEYFSMYFNNGLANEDTVYQSLHQSFLGMVKILYFNIALQNEDGKDKYFTNIIELYNSWAVKYKENEEQEVLSKRAVTLKAKKIKK